jgi:PAS domain S-box-containing protein
VGKQTHTPASASGIANFSEHDPRFKLIFDASPAGMAIVSPDQRFIHCNAAFCQLFGYSDEELQNKTVTDLTHPEDVSVGTDASRRLVEGRDRSVSLRKRYFRKDGRLIWGEISISLVRDDSGSPLYFLPVVKDITERVETEQRLERFINVVDAAPLMICMHDMNGKILYANKEFCALHHYTQTEMHALSVQDLVTSEKKTACFRPNSAGPCRWRAFFRDRTCEKRWYAHSTGDQRETGAVDGPASHSEHRARNFRTQKDRKGADRERKKIRDGFQNVALCHHHHAHQRWKTDRRQRCFYDHHRVFP